MGGNRTKPLRRQAGAVLLLVLLFVLMTTMAAGGMAQIYQTQTQREKEVELLFVGDQYRRAITSYYNTFAPGAPRSLPPNLDALLYDDRFPSPIQHLRRLYPDPMTGQLDWVLITDRGGIAGVHSRSQLAPFKTSDFAETDKQFEGAQSYAAWNFSIKFNERN